MNGNRYIYFEFSANFDSILFSGYEYIPGNPHHKQKSIYRTMATYGDGLDLSAFGWSVKHYK